MDSILILRYPADKIKGDECNQILNGTSILAVDQNFSPRLRAWY
jgi:hypothetical protein